MKLEYSKTEGYKRDTDYWNAYYKNKSDLETPSLFAVETAKYLRKSHKILDLGCGNGRDSLYFYNLGLKVIAIDASDVVIKMLQEQYAKEDICFICDDFVHSSRIYAETYDYCYSRFSLHAIDRKQEDELISNIYMSLKRGGLFFIEARSVHDELYGKGEEAEKDMYIFNGHFRRFLRQNVLEEKMLRIGFKIEYSKEGRGFAPFGDSDPSVIRMILKK